MGDIVTVNAQIVYKDIIPDITDTGYTTLTYPLDMNNDGTTDFNILYYKSSTNTCGNCQFNDRHNWYVKITPLNGNEVADSIINLSKALDYNQLIDSASYL